MENIKIYKNYNNYYNRTLVRETPSSAILLYEDSVNFNPADGVSTVITVGKRDKTYAGSGDYAIVENENGEKTHWFILENDRIRGLQYRVTFRRDLLRDFYNQWTSAECQIERAIISNDSPFIVNDEAFTVNQIKKSVTPLMDNSQIAWICGFVSKSEIPSDLKSLTLKTTLIQDIEVASISNDWIYNRYVNKENALKLIKYEPENVGIDVVYYDRFTATGSETLGQETMVNFTAPPENNGLVDTTLSNTYFTVYGIHEIEYTDPNNRKFATYMANNARTYYRNQWQQVREVYARYLDYNSLKNITDDLLGLSGKIIYESGSNTYYKIVAKSDIYTDVVEISEQKPEDTVNFYNLVNGVAQNYGNKYNSKPIRLKAKYPVTRFWLELIKVTEGDYELTFPNPSERENNKDGPFDIFCIPYADGREIRQGNGSITSSKILAMSIASEIGRALGSYIYDIQLLPYAPMTSYISEESYFDINSTSEKRTTKIKRAGTEIIEAYMFWSTSSSGTLNIIKPCYGVDKKVANQCDMWRIVSPNYNGAFEFSPAKNGGYVEYFNVDYTYLPYNSYIHVNPNFEYLYGRDYDDARGLICKGDFSIMYLSDAWVQYQIQNKNYDNIFDRQIKNMDVNRKYDRVNQIAGGFANALGTGATVGLATGNIAAGIASGVASAIGGAVDVGISEARYKEQKSYAQDMFEYQLDNVRAIPESIAKTTAYTRNNKIFPVVEYYTCTDAEKLAFARMIECKGMRLGIVDYPSRYIFNEWTYENYDEDGYNLIKDRGFIQGKIIRIYGVEDDTHIINEISKEFEKGVYTK